MLYFFGYLCIYTIAKNVLKALQPELIFGSIKMTVSDQSISFKTNKKAHKKKACIFFPGNENIRG